MKKEYGPIGRWHTNKTLSFPRWLVLVRRGLLSLSEWNVRTQTRADFFKKPLKLSASAWKKMYYDDGYTPAQAIKEDMPGVILSYNAFN